MTSKIVCQLLVNFQKCFCHSFHKSMIILVIIMRYLLECSIIFGSGHPPMISKSRDRDGPQNWDLNNKRPLTLLVPIDFFLLMYGGEGGSPPLESGFLLQKGTIFGPEIKFGIIRALNWGILHIFSSILTIFAFSSPKMGQNHNF